MVSRGRYSLLLVAALAVVFTLSLVSAGPVSDAVNNGINGLVEVFKPIIEFLVGETAEGSGDVSRAFLGKLLIMILMFSVVYVAISNVPIFANTNNSWTLWTISIVISILGVRFLTPELINTVILPNSTLGIALTAGLPFVVYFFVVHGFPPMARRIAWIFFGVVFLALWTIRLEELGDVVWIYPITAFAAFLMFVADGAIQRWWVSSRMARANAAFKGAALNDLQVRIHRAHTDYAAMGAGYNGVTPQGAGLAGEAALRADVREYERRIRQLMRT